ncbi:AAA family ATPase [Embleya sp. NPDC127516]|uniref:AAA family ATPase n=1 Tax=Embleya sp. NPDC127516 TaxID=3363990 RepID=UPI00380CAC10
MLHGRNDELAAVTALLQRTRAGDGGAVVLRGAAGAGKTTLLAEAVWEAKGMTVLRTAGPRGGGALPYTALRQLLATLHPRIGRLPHTRAQALRIALGLAPGAADRGVVAAAACSLVVIAAREQPVLILVDDAHWLDAASAAVISYIAGRAEGLPIAVLRATRERVDASANGGNSASGAGTGLAGTGDVGGTDGVAGVAGAEAADVAPAPAADVAVASVEDEASVKAANASVHGDESVAHSTEWPASAGVFEDGAAAEAADTTTDLSSNTAADADSTTNGQGRHGDLRPDATNRAAAEAARFDTSAQDATRVAHVDGDFSTPTTHEPVAQTGREVGVGEDIGEFVREACPASAAERDAWSARAGLGDADAGVSYARCTPTAGEHTKPEHASDEREFDNLDETAAAERASAHANAFDVGPGRSRGTAASGARRAGTGAAVAGGDVPFAALPEDARRLLALAALEPAADLDQLAVAGRRVGIGRGARLAVLRAGLVDTAEHRVRFRNASAREEVRRSLTSAERRSLHGALVYAASGALAYRRPWHLAALATGPDAELAAALEAGAGRTRRELGAGAAAATWEQAARLTADRPAARRRYVAAAYAAWEAGFPTRARTLLDTADAADLDGVADEGTSAHSSGTAIRLRAALRHAEGHRSEAGALLLDAAHGRAALLLAATGAAWEAGDRARTTQARTALAALPLADDDPLRTVVAALGADGVSPAMVAPATRARLYGLGIALWEVTPLAVHAAATDQSAYDVLLDEAAVLRTHGARGALAAALMPLAVAGALSGRAVEAETHAAEGLRLARATGQGTLAAWFLAALSMAATTQGRIAEARDGAWQALRLTGTKGLTPVGAYALYALAVVERAEGRTEAACELLAKALAAPAGALMEVRIRAELATAGPNRSGVAALPPRPTHPQLPTLAGRITRTPQLAAGTA